jgi:hypothetical protein
VRTGISALARVTARGLQYRVPQQCPIPGSQMLRGRDSRRAEAARFSACAAYAVICWAGCRVCGSRREAVKGVKAQELVEAMLARGLQVDTHPAEDAV